MTTRLVDPAKDAYEWLIYLGYPNNRARKAILKAVAAINEDTPPTFEKLFRAAMVALR
jgi:hypothetical protein